MELPGDIGNGCNGAHVGTSDGDGTIELTLDGMMALEMELCTLLLETLDARMLGPQKCRKGKKKRGYMP